MIKSRGIDQHPGTAEDRVLDAVRRLIVTGACQPGEKLTVAALAKRLGVSAMPVRAALRQLAGEGLVDADPNRGARVRVLTAEDIRNLYLLVSMDEGDAPGIAAAKAAGNKMITLDAKETARWKEAAAPIADAWVKEMTGKGYPAADMLKDAKAMIAKSVHKMEGAIGAYMVMAGQAAHTSVSILADFLDSATKDAVDEARGQAIMAGVKL